MKQIEQYNDIASYNSAGKPTTESRVANIKEGNVSKFDGVNVPTTDTPVFGDAVSLDENGNRVAIRQDVYNRSLVPASWTYKGVFLGYHKDGRWRVFLGNYTSLPSLKYADVVQLKVTIPTESGTLTMGAQFVTAGTTTSISVEYEADMTLATVKNTYEMNDTTLCGRINTALAALDGITGDWWAYLDDNGDVILQRDTWTDYRQYICSGALTFVTWGDMPAASTYWKVNGKTTSTRGIMNFAGAAAYWSTNGRTLDANVAVHSEAGSTNPMTLTEFQSSQYAADVRAYYKTYEAYLRGEFGILEQMKAGVFALPDGEVLTEKYGLMMAPTKTGTVKAKFPALNWAYNQGGHLWDIEEGVLMMEDANFAIINATQTKAGKVVLSNASSRWFAQRYNVYTAWLFYGTSRTLTNSSAVYGANQVGAVSLL